MKRNRRAGVEDRWTKTVRDERGNAAKVPRARHGQGLRWLARYVDHEGHEHSKAFERKADAADDEYAALIAVCAFAGLRRGEASALSDVDFLRKEIHIARQVQWTDNGRTEIRPPKYASERTVYIPDRLSPCWPNTSGATSRRRSRPLAVPRHS